MRSICIAFFCTAAIIAIGFATEEADAVVAENGFFEAPPALADEANLVESLSTTLVESLSTSDEAPILFETGKDGLVFENVFLNRQKASSEAILKTLSSLRAYCVLSASKADRKQGSGVIPYLVTKFGRAHINIAQGSAKASGDAMVDEAAAMVKEAAAKNTASHENVVIEYARSMGEVRKIPAYSTGINKYILDRIDSTLMGGTDIVEQYTDGSTLKIRLSSKALGLTTMPSFFTDLSVSASHYHVVDAKVLADANRMIDAAKIWIKHEEGKTVYNSFTKAPTKMPTKLPTVAPTKMPTLRPTVAPTKMPTLRPTPRPTPVPTPWPTPLPTFSDTLKYQESLYSPSQLVAKNGRVKLALQDDGNLVIYSGNKVVWTSDSGGNSGKHRLTLQRDGNLVYYARSGNDVLWKSGTDNGHKLVMQDDCNLVLYDAGGASRWSSGNGC